MPISEVQLFVDFIVVKLSKQEKGPGWNSFGYDIKAEAWGPGAEWALDTAPGLIGARDSAEGFEPQHDVIADLWRHHRGVRITRSMGVMQVLIPTILEQKV